MFEAATQGAATNASALFQQDLQHLSNLPANQTKTVLNGTREERDGVKSQNRTKRAGTNEEKGSSRVGLTSLYKSYRGAED